MSFFPKTLFLILFNLTLSLEKSCLFNIHIFIDRFLLVLSSERKSSEDDRCNILSIK